MGTSDKQVRTTSGGSMYSQFEGMGGSPYSVEARMTERESDGSVAGSYPAAVMENLLRYHNMPDIAAGAGEMVLAGEVIKG